MPLRVPAHRGMSATAIRSCSAARSWLFSASALNVVTKYSQWLMVLT
jgi:hypothetical protein